MQDVDLTVAGILEHGRRLYGDSEVVTFTGDGTRRASFDSVASRIDQLAHALQGVGVGEGDRVATLATNTQEHLEAYFAVPGMGAVLHTLNFRLHPDQLAYVINHAEDKVIIVEDILVPLVGTLLRALPTVQHVVVVGRSDRGLLDGVPGGIYDYDELLADQRELGAFAWPAVDERSAAAMCYTTGTTGDPKGVVYSHRSTALHALVCSTPAGFGVNERDRVLPIVPMFHVNAWGLPYTGWMMGADFVMPGRFLQAEPLCTLIESERPTLSCSIPSIWADILRHAEDQRVDLSSLRAVFCGGSAVPSSVIEAFDRRHGLPLVQVWGMTETSPAGAISWPPKGVEPGDEIDWRARTGRIAPFVDARIVDADGREAPWDGTSAGELEVRGPWVTGSYYKDPAPDAFHDGWLRTGDVGTIDGRGYLTLTDRAKDVIKSGGEWISSVQLETVLVAHPRIADAAVIGVPDKKWEERPLALVVRAESTGATGDADGVVAVAELKAFLDGRVARWWVPERWAFVDEIPKTSVGKIDKKVLRARHAEGAYIIQQG